MDGYMARNVLLALLGLMLVQITPAQAAPVGDALPTRSPRMADRQLPKSEKMIVFGVEPVDVGPGLRKDFRDLSKVTWAKPSKKFTDEGWAALKEGGTLAWGNGPSPARGYAYLFPQDFPRVERKYADIRVFAAPGEYEPASLCIWPLADAEKVTVTVGDLVADGGAIIPSASVDLRVVKWLYLPADFQDAVWAPEGVITKAASFARCLYQPTVLLHDDDLIKTAHIGKTKYETGYNILKHSAMDVDDAASLQPFDIRKNELRQVWLTVYVPETAQAGSYRSMVRVKAGEGVVELPMVVQVLPFRLSPSRWGCGMYYGAGYITMDRLKNEVEQRREPMLYKAYHEGRTKFVHSFLKTDEQMKEDLLDMKAHGVTSAVMYCPPEQGVRLMKETGFGDGKTYITCATVDKQGMEFLKSQGYEDIYLMAQDEPSPAMLPQVIESCRAIKELGGKPWTALGGSGRDASWRLLRHLDMTNVTKIFEDSAELARWHAAGKKVNVYASPQPWVNCIPLAYRLSYGLEVWRFGFDGSLDFAYQWHGWNAWDMFDLGGTASYKLGYTFPTLTKPVPTLMWECFREGNDDLRYLSTLLDRIDARRKSDPSNPALKPAEAFVSELKSSKQLIITDIRDMQDIRLAMTRHILALPD